MKLTTKAAQQLRLIHCFYCCWNRYLLLQSSMLPAWHIPSSTYLLHRVVSLEFEKKRQNGRLKRLFVYSNLLTVAVFFSFPLRHPFNSWGASFFYFWNLFLLKSLPVSSTWFNHLLFSVDLPPIFTECTTSPFKSCEFRFLFCQAKVF